MDRKEITTIATTVALALVMLYAALAHIEHKRELASALALVADTYCPAVK